MQAVATEHGRAVVGPASGAFPSCRWEALSPPHANPAPYPPLLITPGDPNPLADTPQVPAPGCHLPSNPAGAEVQGLLFMGSKASTWSVCKPLAPPHSDQEDRQHAWWIFS